jgi:mannose-1-phosphate guanylyltransferase
MLVLPSDHLVKYNSMFISTLQDACAIAKAGSNLVTLGITPDYPETGYGYIKFIPAERDSATGRGFAVDSFVEKPSLEVAKEYLATEQYLWNSGMFIWKVSTLNKAILDHTPYLYDLSIDKYNDIPKISFDYAIMEKISNIIVISADFGWDDVGTWLSAEKYFDKDDNNNSIYGEANLLNCSDSIIVSNGQKISAIGIQDLIIVSTNNNVFVTTKLHINDIKKLLNKENI